MKKFVTIILLLAIMLLLVSCEMGRKQSNQYSSSNRYGSSNYYNYNYNYNSYNRNETFLGISVFATVVVILLFLLLMLALPSITAGIMANDQGRSVTAWVIGSLFLGWLTTFILALLEHSNHKTYKPKKAYEEYSCEHCGQLITSKTCRYCGFEHNIYHLKEVHPSAFPTRTEDTTQNWTCKWTCKCGAINNPRNRECSVCFSPRPKK